MVNIINLTRSSSNNNSNSNRRRPRKRPRKSPSPSPAADNTFENMFTLNRLPKRNGIQIDGWWYGARGMANWVRQQRSTGRAPTNPRTRAPLTNAQVRAILNRHPALPALPALPPAPEPQAAAAGVTVYLRRDTGASQIYYRIVMTSPEADRHPGNLPRVTMQVSRLTLAGFVDMATIHTHAAGGRWTYTPFAQWVLVNQSMPVYVSAHSPLLNPAWHRVQVGQATEFGRANQQLFERALCGQPFGHPIQRRLFRAFAAI